jgi:hypothetical protein
VPIVFGKRRQKCSTLELQSSKHADIFTDGTVSPWEFLQKILAVKAPRDLYTHTMSQVSYNEKNYHGYQKLLKLDSENFQTMPI